MLFSLNSIGSNMTGPNSRRVNALKCWMIFCIVMVFSALCEFGLILYIMFQSRIGKKKKRASKTDSSERTSRYLELNESKPIRSSSEPILSNNELKDYANLIRAHKGEGEAKYNQENNSLSCHEENWDGLNNNSNDLLCRNIDSCCLILFPILFISFTVAYIIVCVW